MGIEGLEERSLMAVDFLPGPLMGPAMNRTDNQLGSFDGVIVLGADYGVITGLSPALIAYNDHDTTKLTLHTGTGGPTVNVQATGTSASNASLLDLIGHASTRR